jgi:hypothetical protein
MAGKFILKQASSGRYHFDLVGGNGQMIASSVAFDVKELALDGIEAMKAAARDAKLDDQTGEK